MLSCGLISPQAPAGTHERTAQKDSTNQSSTVSERVLERPQSAEDHTKAHDDDRSGRAAWFREGRTTAPDDEPAAAKLHRAFEHKLRMRRVARVSGSIAPDVVQPTSPSVIGAAQNPSIASLQTSSLGVQWTSVGPAPIQPNLAENYGAVTGRLTAIAVDPGDTTGNTVFVGAGGGGVWKSTNAAAADPSSVQWTPLSDSQASLSVGALALQPGNSNCRNPSAGSCVLLAGTGETDNSGDSYYGLGILRSADGGQTWSLISGTVDGKLFHGVGFAKITFSTDNPNLAVAAAAAAPEAAEVGAESQAPTDRGIYFSGDAGQTWNYAQVADSGVPAAASSATSVVFDSAKHLYFAAYRSHGLYSSSDGVHWSRLANQPGGTMLSTTACPAG
ncbi:MAG TPA: hypothetical protein VKE71_12255, partial [Candidatus Angelobacter sp.]|nr:hypothetical protein [Candidatus Angelobacter sp.]